MTPHQALMHQAGAEVYLSVKTAGGDAAGPRAHAAKRKEGSLPRLGRTQPRLCPRGDRRRARATSTFPEMRPRGFAEFHRHFLRDYDCDGLIVDVRYNGGGPCLAIAA